MPTHPIDYWSDGPVPGTYWTAPLTPADQPTVTVLPPKNADDPTRPGIPARCATRTRQDGRTVPDEHKMRAAAHAAALQRFIAKHGINNLVPITEYTGGPNYQGSAQGTVGLQTRNGLHSMLFYPDGKPIRRTHITRADLPARFTYRNRHGAVINT